MSVGYYGGLVLGITIEITYSTGNGIDHYTYTYTVSGDSTIVVTIGSIIPTGDKMYIKVNGTWRQASKIYVKVNNTWREVDKVYQKSSSSWSQTSDKSAMFNSSAIYINGGNI